MCDIIIIGLQFQTLQNIIYKSLVYFGVLLFSDFVIFSGLYGLINYAIAITIFGSLVFLETAALFLAGGIADFSESFSSVNIRRFLGNKRLEYSKERHKKSEIAGASFVLAGIWFVLLAVLMFILHVG